MIDDGRVATERNAAAPVEEVNVEDTGTGARILATADVDARATIGHGTTVWHLAQIREDARVGSGCVIGRGAYIGPGVNIGNNVKLQNYALVYEPAILHDGVFVGPAAVLTNDTYPRAVTPSGQLKNTDDWTAVAVVVGTGASIGARAVCVAPVAIGRWALIAAGAVVVTDVPDFALMAGVPARRIGWVGRAGVRLIPDGADRFVCPQTKDEFRETDGRLSRLPEVD